MVFSFTEMLISSDVHRVVFRPLVKAVPTHEKHRAKNQKRLSTDKRERCGSFRINMIRITQKKRDVISPKNVLDPIPIRSFAAPISDHSAPLFPWGKFCVRL